MSPVSPIHSPTPRLLVAQSIPILPAHRALAEDARELADILIFFTKELKSTFPLTKNK